MLKLSNRMQCGVLSFLFFIFYASFAYSKDTETVSLQIARISGVSSQKVGGKVDGVFEFAKKTFSSKLTISRNKKAGIKKLTLATKTTFDTPCPEEITIKTSPFYTPENHALSRFSKFSLYKTSERLCEYLQQGVSFLLGVSVKKNTHKEITRVIKKQKVRVEGRTRYHSGIVDHFTGSHQNKIDFDLVELLTILSNNPFFFVPERGENSSVSTVICKDKIRAFNDSLFQVSSHHQIALVHMKRRPNDDTFGQEISGLMVFHPLDIARANTDHQRPSVGEGDKSLSYLILVGEWTDEWPPLPLPEQLSDPAASEQPSMPVLPPPSSFADVPMRTLVPEWLGPCLISPSASTVSDQTSTLTSTGTSQCGRKTTDSKKPATIKAGRASFRQRLPRELLRAH